MADFCGFWRFFWPSVARFVGGTGRCLAFCGPFSAVFAVSGKFSGFC